MIDKLGGRKFLFGLLVEVLSFVLLLVSRISAQQWIELSQVIGATYVLGNVVAKFAPEAKE